MSRRGFSGQMQGQEQCFFIMIAARLVCFWARGGLVVVMMLVLAERVRFLPSDACMTLFERCFPLIRGL
jgi:hypothetical protein